MKSETDGGRILYLTGGDKKYEEIEDLIPEETHIELRDVEYPEIQTMSLKEIALFSAKWAANKTDEPVIVDDMGLFVESLNGLPGPFTKYFAKSLDVEGILKLMEGVKDRSASFKVALGFCRPGEEPKAFVSSREGKITLEPRRGPYDYGLNSIFVPEGSEKTLAEYTFEEKKRNEPRRESFKKLLESI